jgi:AraC-like DNA-binding protein
METWTTTDLPAKERFSFWREVLCQAYVALDPVAEEPANFVGRVTAHPLSSINVTTIASTRQKIIRGQSEISKMPAEVYFLNLQVRGQCRMMQSGREALILPGEFSIVDSTKPYINDYCSDDWEQYSFRLPKHLLTSLLKKPEKVTATRVSGASGIGAVAVECLTSIAQNAETLSGLGGRLGSHMTDIIALALGATENAQEQGRDSIRKGLLSSVIQHIQLNVADPDLSPGKVADHFKVSTRYLHKVLEEGGRTFGRILLESRLDRCAEYLLEAKHQTIAQVAMGWGFNDLSHFSRTFRQRFDRSPREYRAEMASGRGDAAATH